MSQQNNNQICHLSNFVQKQDKTKTICRQFVICLTFVLFLYKTWKMSFSFSVQKRENFLKIQGIVKDHFFVYKSRLKRVQNQLLDNFCDWMPKSKFLILYTKLSFKDHFFIPKKSSKTCPKPTFGLDQPVELPKNIFCVPKTSFCVPKTSF